MKRTSFHVFLLFFLAMMANFNQIQSKAKAKFTVTTVLSDTSCIIVNSSTGKAQKYELNFGDGIVITDNTLKTYTHHYASYGVYNVCLIVFDTTKDVVYSDTLCQTVDLRNTENCSASFNAVVDGLDVLLTNYSFGDYNKLMWNFGDGQVSNNKNDTKYSYLKAGVYTISLTIENKKNNCLSKISKDVTVFGDSTKCFASFMAESTADTGLVVFTNQSNGSNLKFFWQFGDGAISNETNTSHLYSNPGVYIVSLTVQDEKKKCRSALKKQIIVQNNKIESKADFDAFIDNDSIMVSFINKALGSNNTNYIWSFGDGEVSYEKSPVYKYSSEGIYQVCLSVSKSKGEVYNSSCKTISVGGNVISAPDFSYIKELTNVVDFNLVTDNTFDSIRWDFGDNVFSTDTNPSHIYSASIPYLVSLQVKHGVKWYETLQLLNLTDKPEVLKGMYKKYVTKKTKATGQKVKYKGSISGDISRLRFMWDFGDGSLDSVSLEPEHLYTESGNYNVCFTVVNDLTGETDTYCETVVISLTDNIPVNKNDESLNCLLWPQPASGYFELSYKLQNKSQVDISVFDVAGHKVSVLYSGVQISGLHTDKYTCNLQKGLYIVQVRTNTGIAVSKLVVQ